MIFGEVSVYSFLDSLETDDFRSPSDISKLVAETMIDMLMVVLADGDHFKDEINDKAEWADENGDSPLVWSEAEVIVNTESHTCKGH